MKLQIRTSTIILFILSPAICFIKSITDIRNGKYTSCKIIPFVMGMFAYLFPPFSDFARYMYRSILMKNFSFNDILSENVDFVVPLIEHYFIVYDLPIEIFRFIYTFFIYYCFNKIFIDITKKYEMNNTKRFLVWFSLFMAIPFFLLVINLRTMFVSCCLTYCLYQVYYNNSSRHRYYSLLLLTIHYAFIPIVLAFFISGRIKMHINKRLKIVLTLSFVIFIFFSDFDVLTQFLSHLNLGSAFDAKIAAYTEGGEWDVDGELYKQMHTLNYQIYSFLNKLSSLYLLWIFLKAKHSGSFDGYLLLLFILLILSASIRPVFARYQGFLLNAIFIYVLMGYVQGKLLSIYIRRYLYLCVFSTMLNIYANWNCLVNGNVWMLTLPVPIELSQTYDYQEWFSTHLSDDFNKFTNKSALSR